MGKKLIWMRPVQEVFFSPPPSSSSFSSFHQQQERDGKVRCVDMFFLPSPPSPSRRKTWFEWREERKDFHFLLLLSRFFLSPSIPLCVPRRKVNSYARRCIQCSIFFLIVPNHQRWKLSWSIRTHTVAHTFLHVWRRLACSVGAYQKISASELSQKFIKSALLVGYGKQHSV